MAQVWFMQNYFPGGKVYTFVESPVGNATVNDRPIRITRPRLATILLLPTRVEHGPTCTDECLIISWAFHLTTRPLQASMGQSARLEQ